MKIDTIALIVVCIGAGIWFVGALFAASVASVVGVGVPALIFLLVGGFLLWRVISDRLNNKEDDYYERNVEK